MIHNSIILILPLYYHIFNLHFDSYVGNEMHNSKNNLLYNNKIKYHVKIKWTCIKIIRYLIKFIVIHYEM